MTDQPTAAMLVIGDEILSGRTRDSNANLLAQTMTELGVQLVEIRMIPDDDAPILTDPERGIGVVFKPTTKGFEIAKIFPGTPAADVDLAKGDLVTAIDGVPMSERECTSSTGLDKGSVVLTVRRGGAERDVAVEVVDLVP